MYCKEVSTPHLCTTARMLTNVFDEITESNPYFNKTFPGSNSQASLPVNNNGSHLVIP